MRNASDDIHPIHLHRNSFELTGIMDQPTSGVIKDVVMLNGYQRMEVEFTADNPGRTLFHCHQQLQMDFGFMCRSTTPDGPITHGPQKPRRSRGSSSIVRRRSCFRDIPYRAGRPPSR